VITRFLQKKSVVGFLLALFAFVLYFFTLAPTVGFIDSGELAAVVKTLGIAHPTGYPFFTLLGWLFAHLPLGLRTIVQLNLMSAFLCALAVFFFFKVFLLLLLDQREKVQFRVYLPAVTGTLVLAFSETFWSQALSLEVYSLHILFLSVLLLLGLRSLQGQPDSANFAGESFQTHAAWYGFAFVLGLSFGNHMTTVLLLPGFLYLFFATQGFSKDAFMKILSAAVPFLLGLSIYLYLPIRASQDPLLNWGDPSTLERFWWHLSGKQYRVWIFSSLERAAHQFRYFVTQFPAEFAYVSLVLALIGFIHLYRTNRTLFFFSSVLFFSCVIYSVNYDIQDIDSYFLLAYVVTAIWIVFGAKVVLERAARIRLTLLSVLVCLGIGVGQIVFQYRRVDASENYVVEDYTKNMFASLERDAFVLSYQWDYFVSASYYFQLVEGYRKDVIVVDKELLRRSWYLGQLRRRFPELIESSRKEVSEFLSELHKFEHGEPYDPRIIQARFEDMIHSFLLKSYPKRPIYVTNEIEPEFIRGFQKVPSGLAFRLYQDTSYHPIAPREFNFRPIKKTDKYSEAVRNFYATAYTNQGIYLALAGKKEDALKQFQKALETKPGLPEGLLWMKRVLQQR